MGGVSVYGNQKFNSWLVGFELETTIGQQKGRIEDRLSILRRPSYFSCEGYTKSCSVKSVYRCTHTGHGWIELCPNLNVLSPNCSALTLGKYKCSRAHLHQHLCQPDGSDLNFCVHSSIESSMLWHSLRSHWNKSYQITCELFPGPSLPCGHCMPNVPRHGLEHSNYTNKSDQGGEPCSDKFSSVSSP